MMPRLTWVCLAGLAAATSSGAAGPEVIRSALAEANEVASTDLAIAAACIERGEETAAVAHLTRYLRAFPDQPRIRAALAELLWRRDRFADARVQYERLLRDAHDLDPDRRIHAHTRLMAIADRTADPYGEHLHRGIGLYLLARQTAPADVAGAEALFCKAAGELTLAGRERPTEARPDWYLYLVWSALAQSRPARQCLSRAAAREPFADLTPAERCELISATGAGAGRR
jgi:tetratricopeptide (TPR) repeat protein